MISEETTVGLRVDRIGRRKKTELEEGGYEETKIRRIKR